MPNFVKARHQNSVTKAHLETRRGWEYDSFFSLRGFTVNGSVNLNTSFQPSRLFSLLLVFTIYVSIAVTVLFLAQFVYIYILYFLRSSTFLKLVVVSMLYFSVIVLFMYLCCKTLFYPCCYFVRIIPLPCLADEFSRWFK